MNAGNRSAIRRRIAFWLPIAIVGLALLAWLFRTPPVPVDLAAVERGRIEVTVSDEGETRVRDVYVVSAPLGGHLRRIGLRAGDPVEAGETVIAQIEPGDPEFLDPRSEAEAEAMVRAAGAALTLARAALRRAEAEAAFAAAELQRFRGLSQADSISRNELDAAERRARVAEAAVEEARAAVAVRDNELQQARARLTSPAGDNRRDEDCQCVNVHSPVSGTTLRVLRESEGIVASGTPLVEVGDPARLEIVVDLLSGDAVRVEAGQRALIEAWGGGETLHGRVRRVEPFGFTRVSALGIEEQRVNVIIDFTDPPERWRKLGHGYRVEPRIVLAEAEDVLKVPRAALFREGESWAVFVAADGRAELRTVRLGLGNGLEAEVTEGLEPGDRVILQPGDRVAPGVRIEARG